MNGPRDVAPIAVSMGDPAGVGLEIAARAHVLRLMRRGNVPPFYIVGDSDAVRRAFRRLQIPTRELAVCDRADEVAAINGDRLGVLHVPLAQEENPGCASVENAPAIISAIQLAVEAAHNGAASAVATLPIAKKPLYEAGFGFPGHTEFIAALTSDTPFGERARGPVMMLAGRSLRVALASIHLPLRDVAAHLSVDGLVLTMRVLCEALRDDFGITSPRVAVCGLNPHAGEGGAIGCEEVEIINPAAAQLRAEGWAVSDAQPADAMFHDDARRTYDAALAMYHDQGLIPLKALHFWDAANITLGLPVVRVSPDHGVAYGIAGKGLARADSFIAALQIGAAMAQRRAP